MQPDAASSVGGWRDAALIDAIASPANEQLGPTVSGDGLELIFSSTRSGGSGCSDLWRATRASTEAAFGAPTPLDGVNGAMCEGGPTLRADGLELLFFRDNMAPGAKLFRTTRPSATDPFGTPTEVTELNMGTTMFPSLSADGLVIVFQQAATPSPNMPVFQAERASTSAAFGAPHVLNELAMPGPGVSLDGDGLVVFVGGETSLRAHARPSVTDAFGPATTITELTGNPTYKGVGTPFLSRNGKELFYTRRSVGNHIEIWRAIRD